MWRAFLFLAWFPFLLTPSSAPYLATALAQAQLPDGTFKAGTKVRLVEEAGSYCVVESEDGLRAHVVVDAVKPVDSGN